MQLTEVLTEIPAGLYVLSANGELAVSDAQHRLHVDPALTKAFTEYNRDFLRAYLREPHAGDRRVAILYDAPEPRSWGRLTLSLEDFLVRDLYPVGGPGNKLTAFQQKNREKSVYRGMELMLEYRDNGAPAYCPVLFNGHVTLAARASALGREPGAEERDIAAIDVLNLIATLPHARRTSSAVLALADRLHRTLIRKDVRGAREFDLQAARHESDKSGPAEDAYADIARDKRLQRAITLPAVDARRLHDTDRLESIERWLRIPHRAVDAGRLREFAQFRALDEARLAELGSRSLVYTAPIGTQLLERNLSDAWNFYLLEGSILLTPADGQTLRVDSGSEQATHPIAFLKPRIYRVDTLTPVSFLWVHDLLLDAVLHAAASK